MANGKSPGPDKMPAEFYKEFEHLVAGDLTDALTEAHQDGVLPESMRNGTAIGGSPPGRLVARMGGSPPVTNRSLCDTPLRHNVGRGDRGDHRGAMAAVEADPGRWWPVFKA